MEQLGHRFERFRIDGEAKVHLGDSHQHVHLPPERPETPPSPLSNVPFPRDPDFVKRGLLSDEIEETLSTPGSRLALYDLGGVGKSQLAIEFAHALEMNCPDGWVFWVHASSAARFDHSIRDILGLLKVYGRQSPNADSYELFRSWLMDTRGRRWLLILDNADEAEYLLEPPAPARKEHHSLRTPSRDRRLDYIPTCDHGIVLITTRRRDICLKMVHRNSMLEIRPMDVDHALELMQKKIGMQDHEDDVIHLATALDSMPLAMAQAAAYLHKRAPRCSVQQYTEKLHRSRKLKLSLLNRDETDLRRDREASNSIIST